MKICACAPGTVNTWRVADISGGAGSAGVSAVLMGRPPKIRSTCASTAALFTSPLMASTI